MTQLILDANTNFAIYDLRSQDIFYTNYVYSLSYNNYNCTEKLVYLLSLQVYQ